MELDEIEILKRIKEIAEFFHVPSEGRAGGGQYEKELVQEMNILTTLIKYRKM